MIFYRENGEDAMAVDGNAGDGYERRKINISNIVGLIAVAFMVAGYNSPMLDFSFFHENIDIQYGLYKICYNIGIISPVWNVVPYGIMLGILLMLVLSFVDTPQLKIIPMVLICSMLGIMIFDLKHVISFIMDILKKYTEQGNGSASPLRQLGCIMYGAYLLLTGVVLGIISCFLPGRWKK